MKNQKKNSKKTKSTGDASAAIQTAIDRAEKEFREEGRLPSLNVQHNPASGESKVTLYEDCEDGMYQQKWRVP